jgi:hypothetical protein
MNIITMPSIQCLFESLYHKALSQTPYEAWTFENTPLDDLRTVGALTMARTPGKQPAKADHHTAHGVLLGYVTTTKYFRFFDHTTNREKLSTNNIIDKAHYGKTRRPPGLQIIMDVVYEQQPLIPAIVTLPPL